MERQLGPVTYDPKVSGPWSDVDVMPPTPPPRYEPTVEDIKADAERERAYVERIMAKWDEWEAEDAAADPDAHRLARAIRLCQPTWADSEECGVTTRMVRAALDEVAKP